MEMIDNSPEEAQDPTLTEAERELLATDPRDYIEVTAFQKTARDIDPDPNHPWEQNVVSFNLISDGLGQVALSRIYDTQDKQFKILIVEKTRDKNPTSVMFSEEQATGSKGVIITDVLAQTISYLSPEARHAFVQQTINTIDEYEKLSNSEIVEVLCTKILDFIPGTGDTAPNSNLNTDLPDANYGQVRPDERQAASLNEFLTKASKKITDVVFKGRFNKLLADIPYTDGVYDKNFSYVFFTDVLNWITQNREDLQQNRNLVKSGVKTIPLSIEVLKHRTIDDRAGLIAALKDAEVQQKPDTRLLSYDPKQAEFVDLTQIVGGEGITNWSILSVSEGRGIGNIEKIVHGFQEGTIPAHNNTEPIDVCEVSGKYFVDSDGRHRTAALKALGVRFAPLLVTHYK